jgi:hypothetical protein
VVLKGISITNADGHYGGAVTCKQSRLDVVDCLFYDNWGTYGGGLFLDYLSVVSVTGCVFSNNKAVGDGGISFYGTELSVTDCVFSGNEGHADGPGAVWGIKGTISLDRCLFMNNWSRWTGAVELTGSASASMTNCTFVRNYSTDGDGSAISFMTGNTTTIERSIFAYNGPGAAFYGCGDSLYVACTDFYGNEDGDWDEWTGCGAGVDTLNGNFKLDPLFCDTLAGDFTLAALSPCMPQYSNCGVLIGAYGLGCDEPVAITGGGTAVRGGIDIRVFPNPFNPRTVIYYDLPASAFTTLRIYDIRGSLVKKLVSEFQRAGRPHRACTSSVLSRTVFLGPQNSSC